MSEVQQLKQKLDAIEKSIKESDKKARIATAIQIAAIGMLFFFGVSTVDDLFKKIK